MLYLIATPIGNLSDISLRALDTLKKCELIYCEDTRRSSTLLNHFEIKKKLLPLHKFNEKKALDPLLEKLQEGVDIALLSDAGTPCINDPGHLLVEACIERDLPFTLIPGPTSPVLALVLSGMNTKKFQYIGFLPKSKESTLTKALSYPGTTIALETPHRIISTLETIEKIDPTRNLAICREMTKIHEECLRGTPENLLNHFKKQSPRGEMVLLIEENHSFHPKMPLDEMIVLLQELHGLSLKEAIKLSAKIEGIPKSKLYKQVHKDR